MSVSRVLASLSTAVPDGGYTITRTTNTGYDAATGDAAAGVVTTVPINAVVEPARGKRLVARIEGRHTEDTILIMTTTPLRVTSAAFQADTLMYLGELYEVVQVDGPFRLRGDTHYEVYAARVVQP